MLVDEQGEDFFCRPTMFGFGKDKQRDGAQCSLIRQ